MISENIKKLRIKQGLNQRELAEKLCVTPQAVSRWENGEVEPSIGTISSMAEIFGVTTDELIGGSVAKPEPDPMPVQQTVAATEQKPVLAVCEQCNKPIYNGSEIVRKEVFHSPGHYEKRVICKACDEKNKKREHENAVAHGLLQRKRSFVWGTVCTLLAVAVAIVVTSSLKLSTGAIIGAACAALTVFPFLSCIFLQNNFIIDVFETITSWTIKMPGLIFSLDLDGIIWLLTVKLALWILGIMFSVFVFLLAVAVGIVLSLFVYPYAIVKNIRYPELSKD